MTQRRIPQESGADTGTAGGGVVRIENQPYGGTKSGAYVGRAKWTHQDPVYEFQDYVVTDIIRETIPLQTSGFPFAHSPDAGYGGMSAALVLDDPTTTTTIDATLRVGLTKTYKGPYSPSFPLTTGVSSFTVTTGAFENFEMFYVTSIPSPSQQYGGMVNMFDVPLSASCLYAYDADLYAEAEVRDQNGNFPQASFARVEVEVFNGTVYHETF